MARTAPYKRNVRKLEFSYHETDSSSKEPAKHIKEKYKDYSESSDSNQKKNKYKLYDEISGEFKKIIPSMFNREIKKGEESKAWLSGMKKYFHIHNYYDELKEKMAIYNLIGKDDIWWQDTKKVKGIKDRYVNWKTFKQYFKIKYLS